MFLNVYLYVEVVLSLCLCFNLITFIFGMDLMSAQGCCWSWPWPCWESPEAIGRCFAADPSFAGFGVGLINTGVACPYLPWCFDHSPVKCSWIQPTTQSCPAWRLNHWRSPLAPCVLSRVTWAHTRIHGYDIYIYIYVYIYIFYIQIYILISCI